MTSCDHNGKDGEKLVQRSRVWKYLCQTTICTILACNLLIAFIASRVIRNSLLPLLFPSLIMARSTFLDGPPGGKDIHDIATRDAVLRLKQMVDEDHDHGHDHDLQSCYYWYAYENFDFDAAATRLLSSGVPLSAAEVEMSNSSTQTGAFPAEIWHLICGNLEHTDLVSMRFASRGLADIAAEYLIQTIYLDTSFESFARLQGVASHPLLRKGVTKLIYEAGLLGDVGCIHNYSRYVNHNCGVFSKPLHKSLLNGH